MDTSTRATLNRKDVDPQVAAFRFFLLTAEPGTWFTYYTGFLLNDRAVPDVHRTRKDPDPVERIKAKAEAADANDPWFPVSRVPVVDQLAREAWRAYEDGRVTLAQRRVGPGTWAYMAHKRGRVAHAFQEAA